MEGKMPNAGNKLVIEMAPWTNGDAIRAMTDEELAGWLGVYCNGQTAQEVGKPCVSGMGSCEECWLDWLREVATDGEQN